MFELQFNFSDEVMPSTNYIELFLDAIRPIEAAYESVTYNFLAIKHEDKFNLVQGRLFLNTGEQVDSLPVFQSENVFAGSIRFSELADNLEQFIEKLTSEPLIIHGVEIVFPTEYSGYHYHFQPFHPSGLQNQNRLNVLAIHGSSIATYIKQPSLDWEVMASEVPYGSLQEVAYEYGVGLIENGTSNVEIVAFQVAAILNVSSIKSTKAHICVAIANSLSTENASVGYNVHNKQKVIDRNRIDASAMEWRVDGDLNTGTFELEVPENSLVHCFANYAGITQHRFWVTDPESMLNPLRAAYEAFDANLDLLKKAVSDSSAKNRARQFEASIACLAWMLGFSPAPIDNISTGLEVSDILASTPAGHFAVVECTTGLLKEDNKIPKLYDRAQLVRDKLQSTGNHFPNVLPVLVTSKSRRDVIPELEQAQKHGILVITREDIYNWIDKLYLYPSADRVYDDALNQVREAMERHQNQGVLPLNE